jgi:hypothetical protein
MNHITEKQMVNLENIIEQAADKLRGKEMLAVYLGLTNKKLSGIIAGEQEFPNTAQEKLEKLMDLNPGSLRNATSTS